MISDKILAVLQPGCHIGKPPVFGDACSNGHHKTPLRSRFPLKCRRVSSSSRWSKFMTVSSSDSGDLCLRSERFYYRLSKKHATSWKHHHFICPHQSIYALSGTKSEEKKFLSGNINVDSG